MALHFKPMLIKSKVKYIQSLSHKKFRDEYGVFVIEGPKIVEEFLRLQPALIAEIFGLSSWIEGNSDLLSNLPENKINVIDQSILERISALSAPNMVLAVVRKPEDIIKDYVKNTNALLLDGIQDPGNLGTIIRTADWFGIRQIFCSYGCADKYNAKVVQSSMGSLLRVDVYYTDLLQLIAANPGVQVYATALEGDDLFDTSFEGGGMFVIGNESKGVSNEILHLPATLITIPGAGTAESLNAAVATGIVLGEQFRRKLVDSRQ
jgi:RNA methyltransferase, TrmH family